MSNYSATVRWTRGGDDFLSNRYSRAHDWQFDGGALVKASASPQIVPEPWSKPENVDPEEAFVASLSSCHMLFFLSIAASKGFLVESYEDNASGVLAKNDEGKLVMTEVTLNPVAAFGGASQPQAEDIAAIHHSAHRQCFIANSVKTKVKVIPK